MQVREPTAVFTITAIGSLELLNANEACFSDKGFNLRLSHLALFSDCNIQSNHDTEAYSLEKFLLFIAVSTKF
jgi:hypothetical protein